MNIKNFKKVFLLSLLTFSFFVPREVEASSRWTSPVVIVLEALLFGVGIGTSVLCYEKTKPYNKKLLFLKALAEDLGVDGIENLTNNLVLSDDAKKFSKERNQLELLNEVIKSIKDDDSVGSFSEKISKNQLFARLGICGGVLLSGMGLLGFIKSLVEIKKEKDDNRKTEKTKGKKSRKAKGKKSRKAGGKEEAGGKSEGKKGKSNQEKKKREKLKERAARLKSEGEAVIKAIKDKRDALGSRLKVLKGDLDKVGYKVKRLEDLGVKNVMLKNSEEIKTDLEEAVLAKKKADAAVKDDLINYLLVKVRKVDEELKKYETGNDYAEYNEKNGLDLGLEKLKAEFESFNGKEAVKELGRLGSKINEYTKKIRSLEKLEKNGDKCFSAINDNSTETYLNIQEKAIEEMRKKIAE